jgi:hypothetical protein
MVGVEVRELSPLVTSMKFQFFNENRGRSVKKDFVSSAEVK